MDIKVTKYPIEGNCIHYVLKDATFTKLRDEIGIQWAERVPTPSGRVLLVDEEGIPNGRPLNQTLSGLYNMPLFGEGIMLSLEDFERIPYE